MEEKSKVVLCLDAIQIGRQSKMTASKQCACGDGDIFSSDCDCKLTPTEKEKKEKLSRFHR